jgi:hypothetical protein
MQAMRLEPTHRVSLRERSYWNIIVQPWQTRLNFDSNQCIRDDPTIRQRCQMIGI